MSTRADVIDWVDVRHFTAYAIDIRSCAWCGDGFARVRINCTPQKFCSDQCREENRVQALKDWKKNNR